jgi:hypothetical protein
MISDVGTHREIICHGQRNLIIAERISARHWIADSGPGIAASVVCMYVCPSRFWNAINFW